MTSGECKFIIIINVLLFVSIISVQSALPQVIGGADFQSKVNAALQLLQTKDPVAIDFASNNVKKIQETSQLTEMCSSCNPPTYKINSNSNLETYWLAGMIIHDGFHSYLYSETQRLLREDPKSDVSFFNGPIGEFRCNVLQYIVLNRIGAPKEMLDYLYKMNETIHPSSYP